MSRMVGGTFGIAVLGAIFQAETGSAIGGSPVAFVDALGTALTIAAIVSAAGAVLAAFTLSGSIRRRRTADVAPEPAI